jgi:transposase InsO family protein
MRLASATRPSLSSDWFNNRRLLEPIGNIPPAEAEARYYAQADGLVMAA